MHPLVMSLHSCDVILYLYITVAMKLNNNRFTLVCKHVCMFVATICSYVCAYVCMYVYVHIYIYTLVQKLFDRK